ncbi:hypothetical protein [Nocardia sp. CY41]|uniref:hypothetical protein n=1 Tax=Nocardia sp. CY41 TaxID=2608686 RepID=UPI00135CC0AE|nr:hypothetical protein [Nocardia sp. CY41]
MNSVEFVRNDQWGVRLIMMVRAVAERGPMAGLFSSTVTGPVCAIPGLFQPFSGRHIAITVPTDHSPKTIGAYPTSAHLLEVPGHAGYLEGAQSIGYAPDVLRQPIPNQ